MNTGYGSVPLGNFITREPGSKVGNLARIDQERQLTIGADVKEGVLVDDQAREIRTWLAEQDLDPAVTVTFKGEDEEQKESQDFLVRAFGIALFLIAIILVTQFNSFYQALLILSAIVFSTVGVLLGLLITQQPFGIVMSGVGVIALAGIVVNNNIVLIDTYNEFRRTGMEGSRGDLENGRSAFAPRVADHRHDNSWADAHGVENQHQFLLARYLGRWTLYGLVGSACHRRCRRPCFCNAINPGLDALFATFRR